MLNARKSILTLAALAFAIFATAQVSVGIKGGMNFNNLNTTEALGELAPDFTNISESNFGLVAEYGITDQFALQTELNFLKKGFTTKANIDNTEVFGLNLPLGGRAETKFSYVEVPLLAKYSFGGEGFQAYLTAGPTFGYATSGRIDTKARVLVDIDLGSTNINLDDINYNRFEVGATAGAGISYTTNFGKFFADARYMHGFTELYDFPLVDEKVRNQGFGVNVGFMVPLN
ncbi:MAG: porin family protein [Saprospiraceae bacterium]|nr:PorT family protein [Lewinella sp.]